jgi:hypothetical protein
MAAVVTTAVKGWMHAAKVTLEQSAGLRETTAEATYQAVCLWGPYPYLEAPTRVAV